jgi:hypothetical protein
MFKKINLLDLLKVTDVALIAALVAFAYAAYVFSA